MAELHDNFNSDSDIHIVIDHEKHLWDRLIQQIIDGNVIPVIGPDILVDNMNPHDEFLRWFSGALKIKPIPKSFSELVHDKNYKAEYSEDDIYQIVSQYFAQKSFTPSKLLERLLAIRQFPFVITTSFTPVVEQVMGKVWKEIRVMKFSNNPIENVDIKDNTDLRIPTVYYMFGKVCDEIHRYVLTDVDMLDFCSSWLSNDNSVRPPELCNALKDKYLLVFGNNYSDWLFRFVWYSMRKQKMGNGMFTFDEKIEDKSLVDFLTREEAFIKKNPSYVVDQIKSRIKKKLADIEITRFNKPEKNTDIFISYSRRDKDIVEKLYNALTENGKKVWYDKKDITAGGNFEDEICRAIETAQYFIPIFSQHIIDEKNEPHVYRNEWKKAIKVANSMGRTYIIPIAEKGFDFYKANIPVDIKSHNAIFYKKEENMEDVAKTIIQTMNNN